MSGLEPTLEPKRELRRIEVITGGEGRRRWSADEKAQIIAETLEPGAVVSEIARRHGLTPQQLFGWRREARKRTIALPPTPKFVPAVVKPEPVKERRWRRTSSGPGSGIELEFDGVRVRIGDGARPATVAAVIRALKGSE